MAVLNPCCCITLRAGTRTVAVIDIIVAIILLTIFLSEVTITITEEGVTGVSDTGDIGPLSSPTESGSCEDEEEDKLSKLVPLGRVSHPYVTTGVWTILAVFLATNIGISAILYTGARNYSIKRCKWWFYIQVVITAVALLVIILIICVGQISFGLLVLDLIHLLYRLYTLWVVYLFIGELTYLDTLCSLNTNKKGGGMFVYAPQQPTSIPPMYRNNTPPITESYHHQHPPFNYTHEEWPVDTGSLGGPRESPGHQHQHYSSDDGLPSNRGGGGGGIDNPTYLP